MPSPALPAPRPTGGRPYQRAYRDMLGRPMSGQVTITGQTRHEDGDTVMMPVSVTVDLVDGVLAVHLPPDTYRLQATLRTVDGVRASDSTTVTLGVD